MTRLSRFAGPDIPGALMHDMYELVRGGGEYSMEHGGQWVPGEEERVRFRGVVLPVNDRDLIYAEAGSYTQFSRKVYTNGHALKDGASIYDPQDGMTYTVKQALGYQAIHQLRRYLVDAKGGAAER